MMFMLLVVLNMIVQVIVVNAIFVILNLTLNQLYILLISALVSIFYYTKRLINLKPLAFYKILYGQAPHQLIFMIWVYFFQKEEYIYYIPLALSTIGKINLLITNPNTQQSVQKSQQLILFQVKCQGFMLGYLTLCLFRFNMLSLTQFVTFAILQKIKYSFYFPSQKAFVQLHFSLDNLTRKWGCRSLYHLLYMGIVIFSSTYSIQRQITY